MGKYPAGTKIRLICEPVEGFRDLGEVFVAAENTPFTDKCESHTGRKLQAYVARNGKVTHCPEDFWERVSGPVVERTVREIVPGTYDGVVVGRQIEEPDCDNPDTPSVRKILVTTSGYRNSDQLTRAAAVLTALAEALREDSPIRRPSDDIVAYRVG